MQRSSGAVLAVELQSMVAGGGRGGWPRDPVCWRVQVHAAGGGVYMLCRQCSCCWRCGPGGGE